MDNLALKEGFLGQRMIAFPKSIVTMMKTNPITRYFYVSDLGFYPRANHHHRIRKKGSNEYIFIYCTNGKGEVKVNNKKVTIHPNHFFIIPKNTMHEYKADEEDPWSIYWFHFKGFLADELYDRYMQHVERSINIPFSGDRIEEFNKIFNLFNTNYREKQIEHANILSLHFISSFLYQHAEDYLGNEQGETVIESVKEFLLENLDKNYMLDDIAEKFNYSASYLHSKFKKETGYPILVFFNLKKIQKSCEYLNYTDLSIKEISFKMGFKDPLYFSRIFKKYMDYSPRQYKKTQRK
ncbi:AraC family transcriptional regulator [Galbibacter mesophilus]|uniref:AraC family transcriptional regulator n=1 Tax=Galbibacter mesophilus TaxID=379069 RepID=UPI00191CDDA1|nr:AraC family transcriptional regulator [Galbibacter mesophilus]MCM5664067.1 AraC family transcriptional regulator [Galbibacter mesophilus]